MLHYNGDNSYLFVNGKQMFKFNAHNENVNFPTQFFLGTISSGFGAAESREATLKGNVYNFSVDYIAIDKSDILNIYKYLMVKNSMKYSLGLLYKCLLDYCVLANLYLPMSMLLAI